MNEKKIMEQRAAWIEELEALNANVGADGEEVRSYTEEESAKAEELMAKIKSADEMLDTLAEQRAVLLAGAGREKNVETRSYNAIVNDFVRGKPAPEYRANETTLAASSDTKMVDFSADIIKAIVPVCPIIDEVSTVVSTGDYKQIIQNEQYKVHGAYVAEAAAFGVSESRWTTKTISKYKYGSTSVITLELLNEAAFDVIPEIQEQFTLDFAKAFEIGIIKGAGAASGEPEGLLSGGTSMVLGSPNQVKADDLISIYHSLKPAYYGQAKWVMNNNTLSAVRKLKDSTGSYLFHQNELSTDFAGTILGKKVLVSEEMPDIGTGAKPIMFGDFKRAYKCVRNPAISLTVLREVYASIGAIGVQGILWVGGAPVNNDAYTTVSMA